MPWRTEIISAVLLAWGFFLLVYPKAVTAEPLQVFAMAITLLGFGLVFVSRLRFDLTEMLEFAFFLVVALIFVGWYFTLLSPTILLAAAALGLGYHGGLRAVRIP